MESNNTWNTVSIFVSSTFSDMQAERDYFKKVVIPHLNEELGKDKIIVQAIDLRGTMSALNQKEERESKILKVCIDAIKENRPFFIGLIGDRYGWIPPKETWNKISSPVSGLFTFNTLAKNMFKLKKDSNQNLNSNHFMVTHLHLQVFD